MRLVSLDVRDFGCVREATVELGPGLTVLYGPNDLGKSTLIEAIRAALLLQYSSSASERFVPWHGDETPAVTVVFETDRLWRVTKSFGTGRRGKARLESGKDGESWIEEARARDVEGRLREELRLGAAAPGGKGAGRGLPETFLTTLLFPAQGGVTDVFAARLDGDADASGRERLHDALAAIAREPLLAQVLERAQLRVDAAFTATGRRRRAAGSPWIDIEDRLRRAAQELEDSRRAARAGGEARARLVSLREERALAGERLAEASALRERSERWLAAARLGELEADAAGADEACAEREAAVERARAALATAERELDRTRSGAERARREARRGELENERMRVEAERKELAEKREAAETARTIGGQLAAVESEQAREAEALEGLRTEIAALEGVELVRASDRLAEVERRAAEAAAARDEASRAREAAGGLDALPSTDELRAAERAASELAAAERGASVGVRVEVRPLGSVELEVARDGGEREALGEVDEARALTAEREVELLVPGQLELVASAGGDDVREALERARAEFDQRARPLLDGAGVETVEALRERVEDAAAKRREAERLEERATTLERQAADGASADELAAERVRLDEALAGVDVPAARALLDEAGDPTRALQAKRKSLAERRDVLASNAEQLAAARATHDQLARKLAGVEPDTFLEESAGRVAELDARAEELAAELASVGGEDGAGDGEAERAVEVASGALDTAELAAKAAREARDEARGAARRAADELQRMRAAARVDDGDFEPERGLDGARLEELWAEERVAREALEDVERELGRAEGALEEAGGVVAREDAERLEEAHGRLLERERELELQYDAWRLLAETLAEVEGETAVHLGRAVMPKIEARFAELTGERYGELVLGPALEAEGIVASGGTRAIEALSLGTQEQLATIFRVLLATDLGVAVLLDDQLTQTDPARMAFFRRLLRAAAETIQVLVVTCHPDDYLEEGERPAEGEAMRDTNGVRAVDLERVMVRDGSAVAVAGPLFE